MFSVYRLDGYCYQSISLWRDKTEYSVIESKSENMHS